MWYGSDSEPETGTARMLRVHLVSGEEVLTESTNSLGCPSSCSVRELKSRLAKVSEGLKSCFADTVRRSKASCSLRRERREERMSPRCPARWLDAGRASGSAFCAAAGSFATTRSSRGLRSCSSWSCRQGLQATCPAHHYSVPGLSRINWVFYASAGVYFGERIINVISSHQALYLHLHILRRVQQALASVGVSKRVILHLRTSVCLCMADL